MRSWEREQARPELPSLSECTPALKKSGTKASNMRLAAASMERAWHACRHGGPTMDTLEGSEQTVCLACSAPAKAVPCEGERGDCLQCYREHGQARHRLLLLMLDCTHANG